MTDVKTSLFDEIRWVDPLSGAALEPTLFARTPAGVPISGVLRIAGTDTGYPIVDCVARLTPDLAARHREWLAMAGLRPPVADEGTFQGEETVDSFGFQWSWNSAMRSEADLEWRVASRFGLTADFFAGKRALDAGAGAGDQSRWMLNQGAKVVSMDLSAAIEVVARKLRHSSNWFGIQGDITMLPFVPAQFGLVYCEGVIQHTRDSAQTVRQLVRMLEPEGTIMATHYGRSTRFAGRMKQSFFNSMRARLSRWERYKLLLATGVFASMAYIPLLGRLVRLSGIATYYDLMPDFKTTWTNTFDNFGNHAYQRYITPEEFWGYFAEAGGVRRVRTEGTVVVAQRSDDAECT